VTSDHALALFRELFQVTMFAAAPILLALAIVGVVIGIIQTATQINEASIAYVAKVLALAALLVFLGPTIAEKITRYTRESFEKVAHVVR
jgi:flagellar biosynthesis protein FliQ